MATPIWKDYFVQVGTATANPFKVKEANMATIYEGIAYKKPGEAYATIKINDICADYLTRTVPVLAADTFTAEMLRQKFTVTDDEDNFIDDVSLYLDWSYEELGDTTGVAPVSDPIIRRVASNQYIPATSTSNSGTAIAVFVGGDYDDEEDVAIDGLGTLMIVAGDYEGDTGKVGIQNYFHNPMLEMFAYDVVNNCNEWALYYVNAYGAWDTLLIEGKAVQTDAYTRHSFRQTYDNTVISNRAKVNYMNEIGRTWQMWTGWLTDDEASRMHHLLGSPLVYLNRLGTDDLIPVVLTNAECPYKKHSNDGMIAYGIDMEVAHDYIRR